MARENAIAIYPGMLGGEVDLMLDQVYQTGVRCQSCEDWFTVENENLYAEKAETESTRFPIDSEGYQWKLFVVCDENAHAIRVDDWASELPGVQNKFSRK